MSFVILHEPSEGKSEVIYVGGDYKKALLSLLDWGRENYAEVSYIKIYEGEEDGPTN